MNAICHAGLSDTGRIRTVNEDRWVADPDQGLYLVADGIGGSSNGGLAAQIVAEVLPRLLRQKLEAAPTVTRSVSEGPSTVTRSVSEGPSTVTRSVSEGPSTAPRSVSERGPAVSETTQRVSAALVELSDQLRNETQAIPGLKGIGSTVVLALVREAQAVVAHLGDSRAYLLRAGRLEQLTKDHTLAQLLADTGEITFDEAAHHPSRSHLTRFIGMAAEAIPEVECIDLTPADRLLLCTDGLYGMLSDQQILSILGQIPDPNEACRRLIAAANEAGGKDNVTAVIVAVGDLGGACRDLAATTRRPGRKSS